MNSDWLSAFVALLLSAIFSGVEIIFLSVNKLQLELLDREDSISGKIMLFFSRRSALFFCITLTGNLFSLVCVSYFSINALLKLIPDLLTHKLFLVALMVFCCALAIVVIGYLLPKTLASINPVKAMNWIILPFLICFVMLLPIAYLVLWLLQFVTKVVLRMEYPDNRPLLRMTHFPNPVSDKDKGEETMDGNIVSNVLEFKSVKVRDCMIPRTEITAVEAGESIERLQHAFLESGFSKIIIFRKTIDDIIGYCHSSSLFTKPASIQEITIPIITAPETTPANELMMRFIHEKKNLAVVMDEFGGTSGIVSAEDIIEEIFGEVDNEPEEGDLVEHQLDENTFLFSSRLEIDYLNETYHLDLPPGDYDTLAGLILSHTENIPSAGEIVELKPFKLQIQSASSSRIGIVKITRENSQNDEISPSGESA
jgi:CBS domain containing-hemolysin-like protein